MEVEDQNIILWSALLHDIKKRGCPEFDSRDPIHPFVSGKESLGLFQELDILKVPNNLISNYNDLLK